jgi:hypothetical protein
MQTISEVKSHPDFMTGIELPEFGFNAYLIYQGTEVLKYFAFREGEILFAGEFRPEIVKTPLTTACELLRLLTRYPEEAQVRYTHSQRYWANSYVCEKLKGYLNDFFDESSNGHKDAKRFFEMRLAIL